MSAVEFEAWPKTPRLYRDIVITEKIDGTNAAVIVRKVDPLEAVLSIGHVTKDDDGQHWEVAAQSRKRLITPGKMTDNFGFAKWVYEHAYELRTILGEGRHFGEWWGQGIQRGYDMDRKRFSLFNVSRYGEAVATPQADAIGLGVVPVMYEGPFSQDMIDRAILGLRKGGSWASPKFHPAEGVIVYHTASRQVYKVLLENDDIPKSLVGAPESLVGAA